MKLADDIDPTEWCVTRTNHDRRKVAVLLPAALSPTRALARLRALVPLAGAHSTAFVLAEYRSNGLIELGTMSGMEAQRLVRLLAPHGFQLRIEDASCVSWFAQNVAKSYGVINDDSEDNAAFCGALIAAGAAIQFVESEG